MAPKIVTWPLPSGMVPSAVLGEVLAPWAPTVATVVPPAASQTVRVTP